MSCSHCPENSYFISALHRCSFFVEENKTATSTSKPETNETSENNKTQPEKENKTTENGT